MAAKFKIIKEPLLKEGHGIKIGDIAQLYESDYNEADGKYAFLKNPGTWAQDFWISRDCLEEIK